MIRRSLEILISETDQQQAFWRAFLQELINQGGSPEHLDKLFADAKGSIKSKLLEMARAAVGDIWKLVGKPITLDLCREDFQLSQEEFLKKHPNVLVHPDSNFTENDPDFSRPCRYVLHHFPFSIMEREIPERFAVFIGKQQPQHTGWRELLAYSSKLKAGDFSGCKILACGSCKKDIGSPSFAFAEISEPERIIIAWNNSERKVFGTGFFFLARDFN